eukprot:1045586-Rhodomonas_salina.1
MSQPTYPVIISKHDVYMAKEGLHLWSFKSELFRMYFQPETQSAVMHFDVTLDDSVQLWKQGLDFETSKVWLQDKLDSIFRSSWQELPFSLSCESCTSEHYEEPHVHFKCIFRATGFGDMTSVDLATAAKRIIAKECPFVTLCEMRKAQTVVEF